MGSKIGIQMFYDIIGDIHGHADKLEKLLLRLNYTQTNGIYHHKERKTVFVGDFVDRGVQQHRTVQIVRNMVDNGHGFAVMGNHEYNAICYHSPKSENEWLRPHSPSNFKQHENFLKEFPLGQDETSETIEWFKTLPLFLEFPSFRVIHACWDDDYISKAGKYLNDDNTLKEEFYPDSVNKESEIFHIIERLLKGVEIPLPDGYSFDDKDGKERHHIRVKWWGDRNSSYQDIALGYDSIKDTFPDDPISNDIAIPFYSGNDKPVFFGHYWLKGIPKLLQRNVACLDYSCGLGEKLVCYSMENPTDGGLLREENFAWVE